MTYKEYADKAKEILEAIKNGNYETDLDAPNFVDEFEKDGKIYLIVRDMDGPKSSNYAGSGYYTVCGEMFSHEFDLYGYCENEPESKFFDMANHLEGPEEDVDPLIEEIKEAIQDLQPSFSDVSEQAAAYARARGITDYEAYWIEDEDCPNFYDDDEDEDEDFDDEDEDDDYDEDDDFED